MTDSIKSQYEALGNASIFNALKYSPATVRSRVSHLHLMLHNKIELYDASRFNTDKQIVSIINSMRTKTGAKLSEPYKRQIALTLKAVFPNSLFQPSKIFKKSNYKKTRNTSSDFVKHLHKLIKNAGLYLKSTTDGKRIDNLALYDMCVVILITCSTSLRINEILQLRMSDIAKIRENVAVTIKSKSHGQTKRRIAINKVLSGLFNLLIIHRPMAFAYLKSPDFKRLNEQSQKFKLRRLTEDYIISSSESVLRVKLHEFAALSDIQVPVLGFNIFRQFITSLLIDKGGFNVAQSINNHSNLNTTVGHYNVVTNETAEKVYSELLGDIEEEEEEGGETVVEVEEQETAHTVSPLSTQFEYLKPRKKIHPFETPSYEADGM